MSGKEPQGPRLTQDGRVLVGGDEMQVGDWFGDMVLRALLGGESPIAVLEGADGHLELISDSGPVVSFEPVFEKSNVEGFEPGLFDELLGADEDVLGERALAAGEPSLALVAGMLPRLVDYAFVGDPRVDERVMVAADGAIEGLLGPLTELPWDELARHARWGIVDARLPLPMLQVASDGLVREQIVVATVGADGALRTLVRRRSAGLEGESVEYLAPGSGEASAEDFYRAVLDSWLHAYAFRLWHMSVRGGDRLLSDLAASSMRLADLTARGCRPRYGIGVYDQERHHSFPPATLHLVHCLLDWGHFERGEELLGCYLDAHLLADGAFDYYGPAVAEYGQMLALAARYIDLTGDLRWWLRRQSVLRPIWRRLLGLRAQSLADEDAPPNARGLIPGLPEADYHGDEGQWRQYYFAGDVWVIRGLMDMARLLRVTGQDGEASAIEAEVDAYRRDLLAAVEASKVPTDRGVFVAPGPTQLQPFERMTDGRHPSYVNYRYWAEMVSAGVLDEGTVRQVFEYRRSHGGELLGMTRFLDHLDDWPVVNYARALVELGEVDRYLLLMYSHLAHHQSAGWLSAYEQVSVRPDERGLRREVAGQVAPCQVTVPQMLRWALAYELRDADVLLVAPCVPWWWLTGGEPLQVTGLTTRWGILDVDMSASEGRVNIQLYLPEDFDAEIRVRVPGPPGSSLTGATVDDEHYVGFDAHARIITLIGATGEVQISATL